MHTGLSPAANPLETALKQVPFLSHLTDDQIKEVAQAGSTTAMGAGQMVFHEGDAGDRVYVILSGSVRIVGHDDEGNEVVLAALAMRWAIWNSSMR